jgi:TonB family protein
MRSIVGTAIVCALLIILPLQPGQFAPSAANAPTNISPCTSLPDDPSNYPDNMIRPRYPKDALRNGASGAVELRAVISPDGGLKDLTVLRGEPEFSQAAVDAIRRWRFHPQLHDGHPVQTTFRVHVRFNSLLRESNCDVEMESPQPEAMGAAPSRTSHLDFGPNVHRMSEPGILAPKQIYAPEPEFSEASRKKGERGNVSIVLVVGSDGLPKDLRIICSSIPNSNENAIEAVKRWKFSPATKDGEPVAVAIEIDVSFKHFQ